MGLKSSRLSDALWEGLKALFFVRVRWQKVQSSMSLALLLFIIALALSVYLDRWVLRLETVVGLRTRFLFDWAALRLLVAELAIPFVIAWFAFRQAPLQFVCLALALTCWHLVLSYGLWIWIQQWPVELPGYPVIVALNLWFVAALWWMIRCGFGGLRNTARQTSLLVLPFAIWIGFAMVKPGPKLWTAFTPEVVVDNISQEEVFEAQRDLLERKLAALLPQRPEIPEYYFLSFAPDASEAVFRRELDVIQPLVDTRLDTAGRSLRLQNSSESLRTQPIATAGNLSRALNGIGKILDPEKDVLLLYLTAHGSRSHQLSAVLDPMSLDGLNAPRLRRYLDESGIKNRVIIISACFSGGFIDTLSDDNTLILTASDSESTSFGCGNESDFTYFGRALFKHGLMETVSLTQAFTKALPVIKEWEAERKLVLSNPQMKQGINIFGKLLTLDERLEQRAGR
jgi:Peptidase C13 family